jgi:abequosyltransferase
VKTISFCIPTRNFGAFIGQALDHIVRERGPRDDVIIVDGNSTDNTAEVVARYAEQYGRIRFERQRENGGLDRDLARSVALAESEYCWLFSADDGLIQGAVTRARKHLELSCDVLLIERIDCDFNLQPRLRRRWLHTLDEPRTFSLSDDASLLHYLTQVRSLAGLFSYMSSIVVKRDSWDAIEPDATLWNTNYAHVWRLLSLLRQPGRTLLAAPDPLVLCRGDNDSFAQQGRIRRFLIDAEGYRQIGERLFSMRPDLHGAFCATFRRDHGLASLSGVRMRASDSEWLAVVKALHPLRYPSTTVQLASWLGRLHPLVRAVRASRNALRRLASPPPNGV